jgi:PST family polysaccharide transporter
MEERAIRGVPWTFLSYAGSKALGVVTTLVLAHLLAPADFGVLTLALLTTSFLYWIGDLGFAGTLVLRQDLDRRGQGTLFTLMMGSSVVAALIALALSPAAGSVFREPRLTGVLAAMSGVLAIGGVGGFYEALLQRELEFRKRFAGYVAQSVVNAAVAIGLAAAGAGVWSLVAGQLASYGAFALVLAGLAPYRVRPRFEPALARDLFGTSRGFVAQGITTYVRQNLDNVFIGRMLGARRLGFYSMGYRLADLSYWGIAEPVARVTFAGFSRSRARGEDIRPAFLSVLRMVALVGIPFGVLLSASADPLVHAVFGDRWLPMVGPLTVLGLWAAFRPIDSSLGWVLNSIGRAGAVAWYSVAVLVPLIPAFLLAGDLRSLTGFAVVVAADGLLSLAILTAMTRRYLEVELGPMWRAVRPVVAAAPLTWVATWGVGQAIGTGHAVLGLIAALAAGLATYAGTISLFEPALLPRAGGQILRALGRVPAPAAPS